jgi:chemotaxis response regulator CheB
VVFGMPKAAADMGGVSRLLPLGQIAGAAADAARGRALSLAPSAAA